MSVDLWSKMGLRKLFSTGRQDERLERRDGRRTQRCPRARGVARRARDDDSGEGPAFSAGRDLADAHPGDEDAEAIIETTFNPLIKRIVSFPAPTFSSRSWRVPGSGPRPRARCDVVYVADDANSIAIRAYRCGTDSGGHSLSSRAWEHIARSS